MRVKKEQRLSTNMMNLHLALDLLLQHPKMPLKGHRDDITISKYFNKFVAHA